MVLPVVLQRQQLADALARYMTQLGLERKAKILPSLSEYLNGTGEPKPSPAPGFPPAVGAQLHTPDASKGETAEPASKDGEV